MMPNTRSLLTGPVVFGLAAAVLAAQRAPAVAYTNARWFDGQAFVSRTVFVAGGSLTFRRPRVVASTVDLHGGFVVPPFGEAHNHNIESLNDVPALVRQYLAHGIFYVKNPNNLPRDRPVLAPQINTPRSVDVAFSNGGWTAPGGHPIEIAQRVIDRKRWSDVDGEGGFYWTAETRADLDRKWPAFLAQQPQFVKAYLLFSEDYADRKADAKYFGWKGLDPGLLPDLAERAHHAKLRVSVHIETAADFRAAAAAGVDEINHMPGFREGSDVVPHDLSVFELSEADAALARQKGIVVVTTLAGGRPAGSDEARQKAHDDLNRRNLRRLIAHQVPIALGSDAYRFDTVSEAQYLAELGVVNARQLLKMWTETTAATIFPSRRIGHLLEGYEASFLVLAGDPLADFSNTTKITYRVKQGQVLP